MTGPPLSRLDVLAELDDVRRFVVDARTYDSDTHHGVKTLLDRAEAKLDRLLEAFGRRTTVESDGPSLADRLRGNIAEGLGVDRDLIETRPPAWEDRETGFRRRAPTAEVEVPLGSETAPPQVVRLDVTGCAGADRLVVVVDLGMGSPNRYDDEEAALGYAADYLAGFLGRPLPPTEYDDR